MPEVEEKEETAETAVEETTETAETEETAEVSIEQRLIALEESIGKIATTLQNLIAAVGDISVGAADNGTAEDLTDILDEVKELDESFYAQNA